MEAVVEGEGAFAYLAGEKQVVYSLEDVSAFNEILGSTPQIECDAGAWTDYDFMVKHKRLGRSVFSWMWD